ncbi:hypothetical protein VZC37_17240 [Gordonia sp. LSe1-13]|uniref:Transmembrane protein n=1 Tax=Gordonia sesuvii TaxID=3116777 RepID=A0ABU7MHK2_9ACTN|nr:hypothetical protein [Gordonia sp. LSe1-13]
MGSLDDTTNVVMLTLVILTGATASACALTAAYVYLRPNTHRDNDTRDRLARRWLVATAVFGFTAIALRFVWALIV